MAYPPAPERTPEYNARLSAYISRRNLFVFSLRAVAEQLPAGIANLTFTHVGPGELTPGRFYEKGYIPGEPIDLTDILGYLTAAIDADHLTAFAISAHSGGTVYLQKWKPPTGRLPWPNDGQILFESAWLCPREQLDQFPL